MEPSESHTSNQPTSAELTNSVPPTQIEQGDVPSSLQSIQSGQTSTPVKKKWFLLTAFLLVLVVVGGYFFWWLFSDRHVAIKHFTNVYTFVPEKISKSAAIQINIPEGVSEEELKQSITFSPEIKGKWQDEDDEDVAVFVPKEPLRDGVYYAVNLDTEAVQMSGDFFVDEDPEIRTILPIAHSETHEDTEISIIFNRPMVPVTVLADPLAPVEVPVTISPKTPGKFKWVSTRNLQFIPETTLIPSSEYTVKVSEGLISLDGLPVAPLTHTFYTRPLRYEAVTDDTVGYRSPIAIKFNQPVDLEKTRSKIAVYKDKTPVAVAVRYGEQTEYDWETGREQAIEDKSLVWVYQKEDSHGRENVWDFETTYRLEISGAVPLAGTNILAEGRTEVVHVPSVISDVSMESERTDFANASLFDPQGTLEVSFYEPIDLARSRLDVKGLSNVAYGEVCKKDDFGNTVYDGDGCEKEPDKQLLRFTFNEQTFKPGEKFKLLFEKIYTEDGFLVNRDDVAIDLSVYPELQIFSLTPSDGSQSAELDGLTICSNVPLKSGDADYLMSVAKAEGYVIYGNAWTSHKNGWKGKCADDQFETRWQYGIHPNTSYQFTYTIEDVFGQKTERSVDIHTKPTATKNIRFQNLQKQYNVTPTDRTKLTYVTENVEQVYMQICKLSPEDFLQVLGDRPNQNESMPTSNCQNIYTETLEMPKRFWVNNYFQIDLSNYFTDVRGHYVVSFRYKDGNYGYDHTYVSVTNLAIGKKEVNNSTNTWGSKQSIDRDMLMQEIFDDEQNLYWVTDIKTLRSMPGAVVSQYTKDMESSEFGFTDSDGLAHVPIALDVIGAVVRSGLDTAVVSDWSDSLNYAGTAADASRTYIYTDRPIYRPGDTVHIRGIDRIGYDGAYETAEGAPFTLMINTYSEKGDEKVFEVPLTVSEYGTFETTFTIPEDASLGSYTIRAFDNATQFSVEEYVPAAFKLDVHTEKEELTSGDELVANIQADYYFGVPLSGGTISYSVTSQDYYFDRYTDEYFNFGSGWYYCYSCGYGDQYLFRGEEKIDQFGRAKIERTVDLDKLFSKEEGKQSKILTLYVTAKDVNGRSVTASRSVLVHRGEYYIGGKTDQYYTSENTPVNYRVKTVDQEGVPTAVRDLRMTVNKVNWQTYKRQEVDGGFYYKSEKELEEKQTKTFSTNKSGDWDTALTFEESGSYEITVRGTDSKGNVIETTSSIYIFGSRSVYVPPKNNYELDIEVEKSDVTIGDTASVLIKSPHEHAKALITVERGLIYDQWVVDVDKGLYLHEFPVKAEYAPNFFVTAMLISDDPEVQYGSVGFSIGQSEQTLDITVTSNKERYLPGEEVELHLTAKDHGGNPVTAEISVAVADLSVLALKGNPKKNPVTFFYNGFPLTVTTASNIKHILHEVDIPLGTKGGGGANPEDLATKKRGEFKDTAYWQADVVTDVRGEATVRFTLPDNLTTWQVESLAVTKDTKLGVEYNEFTTKKNLMAIPLKPRFVVPGDTFSLGANVFNQSGSGKSFEVSMESDTLTFVDDPHDEIYLNADESEAVYFTVQAPEDFVEGVHTFTFTVTDGTLVDSVEQTIAITPNTTYETVATADFTSGDSVTEFVYVPPLVVENQGGLTINANATMAVFLKDAKDYMARYPYGCSEQLSSALSTIGVLTAALDLENVEGDMHTFYRGGVAYTAEQVVAEGLQKIYNAQKPSGGFAYYPESNTEYFNLTIHVLEAMDRLADAGYEVDHGVIARAVQYLIAELQKASVNSNTYFARDRREDVIAVEYVLKNINGVNTESLVPEIMAIADDESYLNERISSTNLAYLAIITARGYPERIKDAVYAVLQNRIDVDGRGAYLGTFGDHSRYYFGSTEKNTALLLKAFVAHEDLHPMLRNVQDWLLNSRDRYGAWGGTHKSYQVVAAFVDYLNWQKETEAHFSLSGFLAGTSLFTHEFNIHNVFDQFSYFVPMHELESEKPMALTLEKTTLGPQTTNLYYDVALRYYLSADELPPRDEGITITRSISSLDEPNVETNVAEVGEVVKGTLTITIPEEYQNVIVEDMIPAGFEVVNFNLATENKDAVEALAYEGSKGESGNGGWFTKVVDSIRNSQPAQVFGSRWYGGSRNDQTRTLYPSHVESHDDRVFLYAETIEPGVYEYEYYLRALVPGEFQHLPARAEDMFYPEIFGRTSGGHFTITEAK